MSCHSCPQTCHSSASTSKWNWLNFAKNRLVPAYTSKATSTIALVGAPNVGKSLLFNVLTGTYVTVSNYPGTTVEVSRGQAVVADKTINIVDTPGMYSFSPITEEERVARDLLLTQDIDLVVHVVDAKNLGRMLTLTFQLLEARLPILLAVNMIDEAKKLGLWVDQRKLENQLGIPVVLMSAIHNVGIQDLQTKVAMYV